MAAFMAPDAKAQSLPTPAAIPERLYALSGEFNVVRFDALFYTPQRERYLFRVEKGGGVHRAGYLSWKPTKEETGGDLTLAIHSGEDFSRLHELHSHWVKVDPAEVKSSGEVRWLAIGDSLTAPGYYIDQTLEWLGKKVPQVKVTPVGTHHPSGKEAPRHEGKPGWSWKRFHTAFSSSDPKERSPFIFGPGGSADFDFGRYVQEAHGGQAPEVITIFLGANDVYGIATTADVPERVAGIMKEATAMVEAIRKAAPQSVIGIVPPPASSDQNGFGVNYGNKMTEWQYRRALQHYVAALLTHFDGRREERIYIVPGYLAFEQETAFPSVEGRTTNALHPLPDGFRAMSLPMAAWMIDLLVSGEIAPTQ